MNEISQEGKQEIEKPPFLYHASANRDVKEFEPRVESYRDVDEGPVVFASPDKAYASMFIVPEIDDSWCQIATHEGVATIVISDEKRFKELDRGGVIYSLPPDEFENDLTKNQSGN